MHFPTELRALRTRAKLSQVQLAARARMSQPALSAIEGGRAVSLATAVKLVEACGARLKIVPQK